MVLIHQFLCVLLVMGDVRPLAVTPLAADDAGGARVVNCTAPACLFGHGLRWHVGILDPVGTW